MSDSDFYKKLRGMEKEQLTKESENYWNLNSSVRLEFTEKEHFMAYCRACSKGLVRIAGVRL